MHPGQTAADRYITSFEGTNYIGQLERIHTLLLALWEEYFGTVRDHPLSEYETDLIDHQLYFLSDALFNIILDMALDYGDSSFRGVGPFLEKAKEAEKAIECNKLVEKARKRQNAARTDWERTEYNGVKRRYNMNENTNTTMNTTEPTTPTPEATGGQGEKLFTQDEVNRIVSERLARERAKGEPDERETALVEREKAVKAKESRYACEDYLNEVGIIGKSRDAFLEVLDTSDFDRFKTIVDRLGGPYISKVTVTGAEVAHPPMNSGATLESRIADAFKPKI